MNSTYRRRIVVMGAAGRDFHNFNVVYRDEPAYEVVAFTAAQIPGIAGRRYPAALAGPLYPEGIAIVPEAELEALIRDAGCRAGRVRLQRSRPCARSCTSPRARSRPAPISRCSARSAP